MNANQGRTGLFYAVAIVTVIGAVAAELAAGVWRRITGGAR